MKRIKPEYLFTLALLAIALIRFNCGDIREFMVFMFRGLIVGLFSLWVIKNVNLWAGLLMILIGISYFYRILLILPSSEITAGQKFYYMNQSYLSIDMAMLGMMFYSGLVLCCSNIEHILSVICVIALIHCLFIFSKYFGISPYKILSGGSWGINNSHPLGITANLNEASALLAICFAAFLRPKWILLSWIPILALFPIKSLNGVLGINAILISYLMIGHNNLWIKMLAVSGIAVFFIYFYFYIDYDKAGIFLRLKAWKSAWNLFSQSKKSFIVGCGNWKAIYPFLIKQGKFDNGWVRLHSTYIQGVIEFGFAFLLILSGYVIDIIKRYKKSFLKRDLRYLISGIIGIAAVAGTNSLFRMNVMNAMFAITILAMLEVKLRQGEAVDD